MNCQRFLKMVRSLSEENSDKIKVLEEVIEKLTGGLFSKKIITQELYLKIKKLLGDKKLSKKSELEKLRMLRTGQQRQPYKCPVCRGRGTVPTDFYFYEDLKPKSKEVKCRSCNGNGIIRS